MKLNHSLQPNNTDTKFGVMPPKTKVQQGRQKKKRKFERKTKGQRKKKKQEKENKEEHQEKENKKDRNKKKKKCRMTSSFNPKIQHSASPLFLYEKTTQMKWGRATFRSLLSFCSTNKKVRMTKRRKD